MDIILVVLLSRPTVEIIELCHDTILRIIFLMFEFIFICITRYLLYRIFQLKVNKDISTKNVLNIHYIRFIISSITIMIASYIYFFIYTMLYYGE